MQNAPLLNIPTPFAAVPDQGHAYRVGSRPLSVLPDSHIPLPSIAEVDMTPRRSFLETRSNSLPESPVSARAANALRASLGCSPDVPLKGRPGTRLFSDDTARQFQPGGAPQSCPVQDAVSCYHLGPPMGTICAPAVVKSGHLWQTDHVAAWLLSLCFIVVGDSDAVDQAVRLPMRHSRSMPSVPTADWAGLATPRNLIEVSARLRSSQELDAQRSNDPLHRSG